MQQLRTNGARVVVLVMALAMMSLAQAEAVWPRVATSSDGTPIAYEVHGAGEPTLVFVHGWSCDGRYWRAQVRHFAQSHRVVVADLAGHGHSGLARKKYTMAAFAADVQAVVEAVDAEQVILIGHSMGGPVSAQAARLMPDRVVGIVGVDTFQNVAMELTRAELDEWVDPLRADFDQAAAGFVAGMFVAETDRALVDWVVADMSAAPAHVAISAFEEVMSASITGEARTVFEALPVPVVAINADLWPTDVEANRRHMHSFDAIIMAGTDHFLHMAHPDAFNRHLESVIADLMPGTE